MLFLTLVRRRCRERTWSLRRRTPLSHTDPLARCANCSLACTSTRADWLAGSAIHPDASASLRPTLPPHRLGLPSTHRIASGRAAVHSALPANPPAVNTHRPGPTSSDRVTSHTPLLSLHAHHLLPTDSSRDSRLERWATTSPPRPAAADPAQAAVAAGAVCAHTRSLRPSRR